MNKTPHNEQLAKCCTPKKGCGDNPSAFSSLAKNKDSFCPPDMSLQGVLITGTGTDIGKTLVTAALLRALTNKGTVSYGLKVIQTGCERDRRGQLIAPDVERYKEACPKGEHSVLWRFEPACSPHLAARQSEVSLSAAQVAQAIQDKIDTLAPRGFACVEGSGGIMVPINEQETFLDIFALLALPAIIVCPNHLGSINHTLLTAHALKAKGIPLLGFVLTSPQRPESIDVEQRGIKQETIGQEMEQETDQAAVEQNTLCQNASTPHTINQASLTQTIAKDNRVILETMLTAPCLGEIPWLSGFAPDLAKGRKNNKDKEEVAWDKAAHVLTPLVEALTKSLRGS